VDAYAKANNIDTEKAYTKMFAGQMVVTIDNSHVMVINQGEKVSKLSGGRIIAERMSVNASTAAKKAANANNPSMKLDHTIPLEFGIQYGGDNSTKNQKMVTTAQWSSYTKVENALGKAIKNGKIKGSEAATLIVRFKSISDSKQRKAYGDTLLLKYK
jgi:hypothetical protein